MSQGADKMKAKLAGVFVTFRGLFTALYLLYQLTTGASFGPFVAIDLVLALAIFASGIAVVTASKKGYLFAVMMMFIQLVLSVLSINLIAIVIDLALLGAIKKGYDIEIKGSSNISHHSRPGKKY